MKSLLVLLFGMLMIVAGCSRPTRPGLDVATAAGVTSSADAHVPLSATVHDQAGRTRSMSAFFDGRPVIVVPVQHRCPNLCGLSLETLGRAIEGQSYRPGRDFDLIVLGIDPRETPQDARLSLERLSRAAWKSRTASVVAEPAAAKAITGSLGYRYATDPASGQIAHIAAIAVLGSDGRLSRWLPGLGLRPADLHLAITEAGSGGVGGIGDRVGLLCFHYDPANGRYSLAITRVLAFAGGLTVVILVGFVGLALARERRRARDR